MRISVITAAAACVTFNVTACRDVTQPPIDDVAAVPVAFSAAAGNPFVGSWESIDVGVDWSHVHMTIGNGPKMPMQFRDDGTLTYGFQGTGTGFGVIISDDPWTASATMDLYTYYRGLGKVKIFEDLQFTLSYDAATDTWTGLLLGGGCWHRTGSPEC